MKENKGTAKKVLSEDEYKEYRRLLEIEQREKLLRKTEQRKLSEKDIERIQRQRESLKKSRVNRTLGGIMRIKDRGITRSLYYPQNRPQKIKRPAFMQQRIRPAFMQRPAPKPANIFEEPSKIAEQVERQIIDSSGFMSEGDRIAVSDNFLTGFHSVDEHLPVKKIKSDVNYWANIVP